jgi:hypothetical protein
MNDVRNQSKVQNACDTIKANASKVGSWAGNFDSQNCNYTEGKDQDNLRVLQTPDIIQADFALKAYQTCKAAELANTERGSGLFAWWEPVGDTGYKIIIKYVAPFGCTNVEGSADTWKCLGEIKLLPKPSGSGYDQTNVYCHGENGGNDFDAFNAGPRHQIKPGGETSITCQQRLLQPNGKPGPLFIRFEDEASPTGWKAPIPTEGFTIP